MPETNLGTYVFMDDGENLALVGVDEGAASSLYLERLEQSGDPRLESEDWDLLIHTEQRFSNCLPEDRVHRFELDETEELHIANAGCIVIRAWHEWEPLA